MGADPLVSPGSRERVRVVEYFWLYASDPLSLMVIIIWTIQIGHSCSGTSYMPAIIRAGQL